MGSPSNALCTIKRAGDQSFITQNWTHGARFVAFKLAAGAFDVTVETEDHKNTKSFTNVRIKAARAPRWQPHSHDGKPNRCRFVRESGGFVALFLEP